MTEYNCPENLKELLLFLDRDKYDKLKKMFPNNRVISVKMGAWGMNFTDEESRLAHERAVEKWKRKQRVATEFQEYGNHYTGVFLGLRSHVSECPDCAKSYMDILVDWAIDKRKIIQGCESYNNQKNHPLFRYMKQIDGELLRFFEENGLKGLGILDKLN